MANRLLLASDSKPIAPRHGKNGFVQLHADIEPRVKDALVAIAKRDGVPYSHVVRDALDFYLDAVGDGGA